MQQIHNLSLLLVIVLLSSFKNNAQTEKKHEFLKEPLTYVNPFLGTAPLTDPAFIGYTPPENWRVWAGLTFPGASLPNAMIQLSPITEYHTGAGYQYEDSEILGFTHTNKGHWNLCNIPILPLSNAKKYPYKSRFSHENESASPAYYQVFLEDYKVEVRLTSTLRAGFHEYTFENTKDKKILFDLSKSNNRVESWEINQISARELDGVQDMGRDKIYFYTILSEDINTLEIIEDEKEGHAIVHLKADNQSTVTLKIGLSFVSKANAKKNLMQEIGHRNFDEIHKNGAEEWNKILSRIEVSGGTEKEKMLFYSSLYRVFLWPALRSDVNGQFTNEAGKTRTEKFKYYTISSLWDTYRNKLVLLGMIQPEVTGDVIQSLVDRGNITGFMPTFFHGDHAAPFIASSYFKGIKNFNVDKAYELLLNNAYKEGGTRPHIKEYIEKGYISEPVVKNPKTETVTTAGVSKTLEFAHDDYALALLAKSLGDTEHHDDLMKRSKNYKNVFDSKTNFMRGRLKNGDWVTPFDPTYPYYEYMYREANGWQVSFYVPHDMPGLVDLYGGNEPFEKKLDSLFSLPWNPKHIARNISGFLGQYCHGNQPDHEAPFSYYFIDKPEKSQKIIDKLLKDYHGVGEYELALAGMDDAGELSSWYVFSALGLYPLSVANNEYVVTIPIFDAVKWKLNNGKELLITHDGKSRVLKGIEVNSVQLEDYIIPYHLFESGGVIDILKE
ncbi:GH92 family glycosyl hydrolase [Gelidibacter mesophilus]|uniref:GH92 family glycosyl hydrolase n=1 Tax=Gelidibacter mesophilus TaxID=169050 RepID=UPI0003FFFF52|nr:GH92 family glycosyl hydrolase [Gelidibacter mesophilus]